MIDLTPLDVRKKRDDFKRALRGYDPAQVDAFLEIVSDRLEQLVREHGTLADQSGYMQKQLDTYQERERALNEALLAAQELREEARSQSERDAAVRLREAETHAEAILLDADQAIRHSGRRLDDLRARRRQFLKSLRSVMERFEDYLELEESRLEMEPEDLGDLLERLEHDLVPTEAAAPVVAEPEAPEVSEPPAVAEAPPATEEGPPSDRPTMEFEDPSDGEDDSITAAIDVSLTTGDSVKASEVVTAPSTNGHADDGAASVTDPADEGASGSRIATPQPITPGDAGEPGSSTN